MSARLVRAGRLVRAARLVGAARLVVVALALAVVAEYAYVAVRTITYPYALEWMEGGVLDVVARVRAGEPIYVPPTVEYTPHVYPPLYFWVTALASRATGLDLVAGRVVSLLATVAICALLFVATRRATRSLALAAASPALFLATYPLTARWFHLARVDMLCLALVLAAIVAFDERAPRRSLAGTAADADATDRRAHLAPALSGTLFALAFLAKQPAALAAMLFYGCALLDGPRRALVALGTFTALSLASVLALSAATDGWFTYYALDLPGQHPLALGASLAYVAERFWVLAPAFGAAVLVVVRGFRAHASAHAPHRGKDLGLLVALVATSLLAFAHTGAETNALLPATAALALLAPRVATDLARHAGPRARTLGAVALAAFVVQLALLVEPPSASLPAPDAEAKGDAFLAWIAAREGEVLIPDFRFVQTRVGKRSFGLGMAARDVLRAERGDRGRALLEASIAHALEERRFSTVVLSQRDWLGGVVAMAYDRAPDLDLAPWPVSGYRTRPSIVFQRREAAEAEARTSARAVAEGRP